MSCGSGFTSVSYFSVLLFSFSFFVPQIARKLKENRKQKAKPERRARAAEWRARGGSLSYVPSMDEILANTAPILGEA